MLRHLSVLFLLLFVYGANAMETDVRVPLTNKGLMTLYVTGNIAGYGTTEFMVDTGSGYTTINQATLTVLKDTGKAHYVRDLAGTMADGTEKLFPVYRIDSLTIGESCQIHNIEVALLPGKTRNILGMNVLQRAAPFTISMHPPQLHLAQCTAASPMASN